MTAEVGGRVSCSARLGRHLTSIDDQVQGLAQGRRLEPAHGSPEMTRLEACLPWFAP